MPVCYLCGHQMITQEVYDQNPKSFPQKPAIVHDEHIIQNALYGRLKSSDILCLSCGTRLSTEIDADFNKLFSGITEPIKHILAKKDHGGKPSSLRGYVFKKDGTKMAVQIRDNKVLPLKPEYEYFPEKHEVELYVHKQVAKGYQKLVLKELSQHGVDVLNLKVTVVDDITHFGTVGVNFSEGVEGFNSKFKMGFNKIATGFASLHGIDRADMPCTIDAVNNKLIFTTNVIPFYPAGIMDMLIEAFRISQEPEFPTHTLSLFTDDSFGATKLVCYVDLFSTFQHYVILNHDYKGPAIKKHYYQTIIKQERPELNIKATRMKYLFLIEKALDVQPHEMAGLTIDQRYEFLEKRYRQYKVNYELNLDTYLKHIGPTAATHALLSNKGYKNQLSPLEEEIMKGLPELKGADMITLHSELERFDDENPSSFHRETHFDTDNRDDLYLLSTLDRMIELYREKFEGFATYGHIKFYTLIHFISENQDKEK